MATADQQEAGFTRQIIEDPADTATRLVYADWLAERGRQDEADRQRQVVEQGLPCGVPLLEPTDLLPEGGGCLSGRAYLVLAVSSGELSFERASWGRLPSRKREVVWPVSPFADARELAERIRLGEVAVELVRLRAAVAGVRRRRDREGIVLASDDYKAVAAWLADAPLADGVKLREPGGWLNRVSCPVIRSGLDLDPRMSYEAMENWATEVEAEAAEQGVYFTEDVARYLYRRRGRAGQEDRRWAAVFTAYGAELEGQELVDLATAGENPDGHDVALTETAGGAWELRNGDWREVSEGGVVVLRRGRTYKVSGGRWSVGEEHAPRPQVAPQPPVTRKPVRPARVFGAGIFDDE